MSLLDELLKKAERRPDKVDIPPQVEQIVARRNKRRIYVIFGLIIFTIFSGILLLALMARFTGFTQVEEMKIVRVSEIRSQKSDNQPQSGIPGKGQALQNFNSKDEDSADKPVYSPVKSGPTGKPETMGPEIVERKVRQRDTEKKELKVQKSKIRVEKSNSPPMVPLIPKIKVPDSMVTPGVSGTEIPKQDYNQTATENGKVVEKRGLLYRANTFESNGHYEEAIEYYERALKIDPSDYRVMNQIAYLYIKLGVPDRAIEYIDRLKKFRSDYVPSMINLSVALMMKAEYEEAEMVLLEVLGIEPFNKTALFNLAILYENKGRFEEAEGYYKRLLSTGDLRGKEGLKRIRLKKPLINKDHNKNDQDGKENPES
ncbi:MAG: tetratricopeptide repeat protein [Thermodesulfovibrionales bacterium]